MSLRKFFILFKRPKSPHPDRDWETILCERCQVALNKTELMHVYRCPVCLTVTEQFPKDQTIVESDEKN